MAGRVVLHVDMDFFYAQLEERENPGLRGKPVVVCMVSGREGSLGAVATCNYVARNLGVHAGMACVVARKKAPDGVFVPARRDFYVQVSDEIMDYMEGVADVFEQVSVDEAYLDISKRTGGDYGKAENLALEIKAKILESQKLTCSVGACPNKLVAKIAAGYNKPDGLRIVRPEEVMSFLSPLPFNKLYGIGDKAEESLGSYDVKTIGDMQRIPKEQLIRLLGEKRGSFIYDACRGIDERPVSPKEREQYGNLASFRRGTRDWVEIEAMIGELSRKVASKVKASGRMYRTVTVTFITEDLQHRTKSRSLEAFTQSQDVLRETAKDLARRFLEESTTPIRRLGVGVSNLSKLTGQKTLFDF